MALLQELFWNMNDCMADLCTIAQCSSHFSCVLLICGLLWQQVFEEEREELAQIPRNEMTEELVKEMPALRPHFEKYKQWRLKRDESIAMKSS